MSRRACGLPLLVCAAVHASALVTQAADFWGKVGVSGGDTLTVLRERTPVKIRLHGIDAPETGRDFGARAKAAAADLGFGKIVTVQPLDSDRNGLTRGRSRAALPQIAWPLGGPSPQVLPRVPVRTVPLFAHLQVAVRACSAKWCARGCKCRRDSRLGEER